MTKSLTLDYTSGSLASEYLAASCKNFLARTSKSSMPSSEDKALRAQANLRELDNVRSFKVWRSTFSSRLLFITHSLINNFARDNRIIKSVW